MKFVSIHEAILNSMSDAVYVVDSYMRIQYANSAAEKMTGWSFDESIGRCCHEIFCERSSRCDDGCPLKKAIGEKTPVLLHEAKTRGKNGEVRRTQISFSPFFDDGECIGSVAVIKDVTELKKAEKKIRAQNRFLTAVIDALPHPFMVVDAETYRLKLANYAAYQGRVPEHMTCHELSHHSPVPCSGKDHPCPLEQVRETGLPVIMEHSHCGVGGRCRDVEVHGFPIFDDKGRLVQMIEYCIDISERKKTATQREQLIQELQNALDEVNALSGLLPICSSCKKIRDDQGYWNNLEMYISQRSAVEFSHGICPDCAVKLYPEYYKKK